MCSRSNPWHERCLESEVILDTWKREGVGFAFGARLPTSGHKRGLFSCTRQMRVWPDLREIRSRFYCNGFRFDSAREGAQSEML